MRRGSRNAEFVGAVCAEKRVSVSCVFITQLLRLLLTGRLGAWHPSRLGALFQFFTY